MAEAIRELADQPERLKQMGRNARRLAEEVFDRDKLAAAYLAVLLRPLSGRNGECKNGRGAGEEAQGACDGGLVRGEPGDGSVLTQRRGDAETQGFYPHLCDHWVVAKRGRKRERA